jgi:hypothetical protein
MIVLINTCCITDFPTLEGIFTDRRWIASSGTKQLSVLLVQPFSAPEMPSRLFIGIPSKSARLLERRQAQTRVRVGGLCTFSLLMDAFDDKVATN